LTVRLAELTQDGVAEAASARCVVLLPVSPLEEHGPHLPVGTDIFLSEALAERLGTRLEERWPDAQAVICPSLAIGSHVVPGPGSVAVRPRALRDSLVDYIGFLGRSGFRYFVICSGHAGMKHLVVLEEVAEACTRVGLRTESALSRVVIPFLTGRCLPEIERRMGRSLTADERAALRFDVHGGQWETGAMLLARPDLVDACYRDLPHVAAQGWRQLKDCMMDSCARGLGYVGHPAGADTLYAEAAAEVMVDRVLASVDRMLHSGAFRPAHTPFYYSPRMRTQPVFGLTAVGRAMAWSAGAGAALGLVAGFLAARIASTPEAATDASLSPPRIPVT